MKTSLALTAALMLMASAKSASAQWMAGNLERPVARAARTYWPGDRYHRPGYGYAVHEQRPGGIAMEYSEAKRRTSSLSGVGSLGYKAIYRPPHGVSSSPRSNRRGAAPRRRSPTLR
jgi:hypothetical protein